MGVTKKTKLKNLMIKAVALVDEGSCSQAHINLCKRKGGEETMKLEDIKKSLTKEQQDALDQIMKDKEEEIKKACGDVSKADNNGEGEKSKVSKPGNKPLTPEEKERLKAAMEKGDFFNDGGEENGGKAGSKAGVEGEDKMLKSLPPEVREIIEKANSKAAAAEAIAKKYMDQEENRQAIAKARAVKNIPVEENDLVGIIKGLSSKDSELANKVYTVLEKANAIIEKSVAFKSTGTDNDGGNMADEDQAWAEIEKLAEPIAKSKNITKEAAVTEVIKEKPELYKAYVDAARSL